MALSTFGVVGKILAAVPDSSADPGGEPDIRPISCTCVFTPKPHRLRQAGAVTEIRPLTCRTNLDTGEIETIDVSPVSLIDHTGTDVEHIQYTLSFVSVVVPGAKKAKIDLEPMIFFSPGDGSTIDLGTVSL